MNFFAKKIYHWKELEKLVKKVVSVFAFGCKVLEIEVLKPRKSAD